MSVINKQPYIETVVASLSKENLTALQSLLNGTGTKIFRSFINQTDVMSTSDKGVAHMVLEAKDQVFTGYLLYNNSYCVLVAYEGGLSQKMFIIKLDYSHDKYEIVEEPLTIDEFRRIVEDRSIDVEVETTEVEANPELVGTEDVLTGIQIGDKKYKIPQSSEEVYSASLSFTARSGTTIKSSWGKISIKDNIVKLILTATIANETENSIIIGSGYGDLLNNFASGNVITLPSEYASKLYDISGNAVADTIGYDTIIFSAPVQVLKGKAQSADLVYSNCRFTLSNRTIQNVCCFSITPNGVSGDRITLAAGETLYVFARMEIELDNIAG